MGQKVFEKLKTTASKHFSNHDRYKLDVGFLGFIPYDEKIMEADLKNVPPYELSPQTLEEIKKVVEKLKKNSPL